MSAIAMKKGIIFFIAAFLATCVPAKDAGVAPASGPDGLKAEMPDAGEGPGPTSPAAVEDIMNYLASDELKGRDTGSEGIELAAQYIEEYFQRHGIAPYYPGYRDTLSNFKKPAYNVVGWLEGNDPDLKGEYILLGAHYDHIGTIRPLNGDYIANGANDNASGTTAVMEIAKHFGRKKSNKRSLIFALFSGEERGLLGSKHMAKNMKASEVNLYTMLNFEMIGVPLRSKNYDLFVTGYYKSNLAEVSNKYAGENFIGYSATAREYNLFQRSDNYPFYQAFGIPSHTYCTFDFTNFAYYHKVDDEVAQLDLEHMARLINKMIPMVEGIANSPVQEVKMN